jgi:hypothetical protein
MNHTLVAAAVGALIVAAPATVLAAGHAAAPTRTNFQVLLTPSGTYPLTGGAQ